MCASALIFAASGASFRLEDVDTRADPRVSYLSSVMLLSATVDGVHHNFIDADAADWEAYFSTHCAFNPLRISTPASPALPQQPIRAVTEPVQCDLTLLNEAIERYDGGWVVSLSWFAMCCFSYRLCCVPLSFSPFRSVSQP